MHSDAQMGISLINTRDSRLIQLDGHNEGARYKIAVFSSLGNLHG
jgi:hypothetical protein